MLIACIRIVVTLISKLKSIICRVQIDKKVCEELMQKRRYLISAFSKLPTSIEAFVKTSTASTTSTATSSTKKHLNSS